MTVNEGVQSYLVDQQRRGITADTPIYGTPSLNTLIAKPWAKDNLILQTMAPMVQDRAGNTIQTKTDFSQVMQNANNLIASGKLTESQAVQQINGMTRSMMQDTSDAFGAKRFACTYAAAICSADAKWRNAGKL